MYDWYTDSSIILFGSYLLLKLNQTLNALLSLTFNIESCNEYVTADVLAESDDKL